MQHGVGFSEIVLTFFEMFLKPFGLLPPSFDSGRHQMLMHSRAMRACATTDNFFIFLDWVLGQSGKIKS